MSLHVCVLSARSVRLSLAPSKPSFPVSIMSRIRSARPCHSRISRYSRVSCHESLVHTGTSSLRLSRARIPQPCERACALAIHRTCLPRRMPFPHRLLEQFLLCFSVEDSEDFSQLILSSEKLVKLLKLVSNQSSIVDINYIIHNIITVNNNCYSLIIQYLAIKDWTDKSNY